MLKEILDALGEHLKEDATKFARFRKYLNGLEGSNVKLNDAVTTLQRESGFTPDANADPDAQLKATVDSLTKQLKTLTTERDSLSTQLTDATTKLTAYDISAKLSAELKASGYKDTVKDVFREFGTPVGLDKDGNLEVAGKPLKTALESELMQGIVESHKLTTDGSTDLADASSKTKTKPDVVEQGKKTSANNPLAVKVNIPGT
jgi:hypothetical protein